MSRSGSKNPYILSKEPCILSKEADILSFKILSLLQDLEGGDVADVKIGVKRVIHSIKRALHSIDRALHSIKRALHSNKRVLHSMNRALYSIKRAQYSKEPCILAKEPYILSSHILSILQDLEGGDVGDVEVGASEQVVEVCGVLGVVAV